MGWDEVKSVIDYCGLKRVQRGTTSGAGNVAISPVNMEKAYVISVSKGSAGTVAATGTVGSQSLSGSTSQSLSGKITFYPWISGTYSSYPTHLNAETWAVAMSGSGSVSGTVSSASISGGTTNLTVKEYSARLTASDTLYCDGPVEWQIIEYYGGGKWYENIRTS